MAQKIVSYSGEVLKPYTEGGSSEGSSGYSGEQKIVSYSGETLSPYSSGSSLYKYAESLEQDTNQFIRMANRDNSGDRHFNAAEYFEERKKQADALKLRAADLSRQMETDVNYNPESYQPLIDYLSNFDTMVDDVLSSYKPSLDAREGMRAYEDEFIAAQERNEQLRGLDRSADFAFDPGSPAANIMAMFRQKQYDEGDRGIKDNWSDEQRYRLGLMQMEDPTGAKQYAKDVNAGQDPYVLYEQQEQQKADWRAMDLNAERREIDRLKAELDDYYWNYNYDATATNARNAFDQEIKRMEKEISDREQQYNLAKREQESAQFASAAGRNDFKAKSGYVDSGFVVPNFVEDADPDELVYEYINDQSVRSQINQQTNTLAAKGYDLLTPEEVGIYNYYYATEGAGKAQQYLDNIQDTLNQRIGERGAAAKQGELWKQLMAAGISGYSNAVTSPQYFFNKKDDYINTSPFQYMSAAIREDLADTGKHPFFDTSLGQVGYDLINTTANMAPSMLLSAATGSIAPAAVGAAVGSATMGLSAAGGAYQQALNSGYTKEQARTYAALSGASEVALEYLLGGISKLGGEIPQKVISDMVSGIDNAIGRAAVQIGGSMASEGFEEGLQEVITPWIENLTLYADKNVDWNEVAYSTLLGALSGGVMEAPGVIKSETQIAKINNQLINLGAKGNTREMAELIAKYKNQEVLSDKELIKLVNSEPAMEIIRGKRNSSNESATVIEDAEVPKAAQPKVSKDGRAIQISTDNPVDVLDFASMDNGVATVQLNDGETAAYDDIAFKDQQQANQFYAVRSLPGLDTESANNLLHTIQDADAGKDIDSVVGIREAYAMGYYNQSESDLAKGDAATLTPELRKAVFDIGRQQNQVQEKIQPKAKAVTAKPTQGYKKITIEGKITKLDKKRKAEMAYVDTIADNFAGTAVHVYESYVGADGKRYFRDNNGVKHKAPNGKYINGEIWLDINSGDNGEGMMLNTFAHEMYHHIERYNKAKANELAAFVSKELGIDNVDAAVQRQIDLARSAGYGEQRFIDEGMTPEQAANEVYSRAMSDFVADSLETMFTRGNPAEAIAKLKTENRGLCDEIKAFIDKWVSKLKKFYQDKTISMEGEMVSQLKNFEELQQLFMEAMQGAGENYQAALENAEPAVAGAEMSNEEAFLDSATAVHFQIRPPYADGSKAFNAFVDDLNPEARKTFDLFYGFYQRSRITNTVSVSGKKVKAVNISALYLLAQDWNDMLAKEPKWAAAAKDLADFLPADVRKRMNMNEDGTLNPTTMEKEFKMPSSMAQRLVDALPYESIEATYKLGDKTVSLPEGKARQSVGGEAYRRAILNETRKMFSEGKLKPVGIGTMSKDRWGSLGFLAANGKTGASGDFTTVCPQMMFNRGCWYCYRRAAMEKGVNNKLVANSVWYTGEILRIKDKDIESLNRNGGLRIQSFGDWMPHFSAMLADVLYDAELRGLQVKIITKEPSMINYIAALRDQNVGKNLYFNLSADYTIEKGPAKQAQGGDSLDAVNPERPYMRDRNNNFWWKRAMTVEEAAKYREKYPWVNTRIVATDIAEFIRGLKDNRVDVVTGYHGNIRGIERIDSATGAEKVEVEALGDAGMPRFAFNPTTGTWFTEYEGKTATHKRLAQAIADNGLQWEYYIKTCCITGRCATCEGKCGALARDFNVKNATNRDTQSVAYWQTQMEYAVEPEFGDLTDVQYSFRGVNKDGIEVYETSDEVKNLTKKERQERFLDIMKNEYRGRTAKFIRNGHAYYATFDEKDINKNIYGDKRSDKKGYRAKINSGADGDIFELVENSKYDGSKPEKGKKIAAHNGVGYWDYFIKTVQIDNVVYNMNANVRKKSDGAFVYSIQLNENKKIKASPPLGLLLKASNGVTNASGNTVAQTPPSVNTGMNSLRNEKPLTDREILAQINPSKRNETERYFLGQYQDRLKEISEEEPRLVAIKKQMESLDPKKDKAKLSELRIEAGKIQRNVTYLKKKVRESEGFDMFKRMAKEERNNRSVQKYKEEQKRKIKDMQMEQRVLREELTGKKSDITIMEREFIRIAKQYEKLDAKTGKKSAEDAKVITELRSALKAEAAAHREDSNTWEREFNRLLRDYETSGRQIERLEATILRQRQTAKERVAGRRNTEMRHKIQKKVNQLDQLLRHGSKHRNVPEFLQDSVAAVLQAINMEVRDGDQRRKTFEATIARYDRQIAMISDPDKVTELIRKRNEYEAKGDQFANRMDMLQAAYKQIREENTGMELDEVIADKLDSLFEVVGNTPLGQMNAAQLEAVNDILNVTQATIRNANQLLAEERSAGVVENSKDAIREIRSMGDTKKKKTRIRKELEKFGWNNLKPIYVFDVIGSKTLTNLYNALRGGEDTLATDLHEAKSFFQEQWKKNNGKEWDMDQKWTFTSTSGKEFELDLNQIMTLYAMAKDEDARSHLRVGGFSFDNDYQTEENVNIGKVSIPIKMESADASAYNLSDEILGEIISKLTPQQRAFADAMQAYLSDVMAAKGNEVSLKKYGIRLFKKKNYFPIRVADQFMAKAREQRSGDRKLKDSGFTKERKPQAKNPVVLSAFTEIWAEHVDEMSLYHSFVLPLDDFNRVLNYHDMFVEGQDAVSVVEAITNAFGKGATDYIDQLIKDVNGGIRSGSTVSFANSLVSKAKKAQTMASLSVAIQQPSSIIRAMSMIDSRYFIGPKVTERTHDRTWDEIKQYAPIAYIKEMGGYDTNVGKSTVDYLTDTSEYSGFWNQTKAMFTDKDFRKEMMVNGQIRDDYLGRLPAWMDEVSWGVIWNAVKREQSAQHPNMDVNSKAFMKLVADRFTDVITRTQVYDSVFSRNGLMRDKNDLAKVITSFMAEPTTTANMLAVSILQAKRGDISKAQRAKTTAAIVASLALNAALVSIVYAMRDDDEDKRYDEKWMENFRNNFFESLNPAGYIPYVRDIYNVFVKGYDVERADMELFGDLQNALDGLKNDDISAWDKTSAVIGSIGNLLGVPVKNILRDVKGIVQTAGFAWDDKPNPGTKTGAYMARRGMDLNNGEEMILALQRGDMEHIQRVFGRYESQEKAESALQSAIGEKYRAGEMSAEEATQLLTDYFDREEYEVYWILDKWDYAVKNGTSEGYSKYGVFLDAIDNGGDYATEMQRYLEHGAEMSDIRSAISGRYKKQYLEADEAGREEIRNKLTPVFLETDMYQSDIDKKFNDWNFEAEYDYTYSAYKAAYRDGEITEQDLRDAMKFYGLKNFEIDKEIRGLNEDITFRKKYGMTLSEMKDAYDNGDVAKNTLQNALIYSGMTKTEAQDWIKKRDISNRLGIDYMELDDAYKAGDITRQQLYNSMIEAGSTRLEADEAIAGYDWLKKNYKRYPDLTISDAKKFVIKIGNNDEDHTLADYGVTIDHYIQYAKLKPECKGVDANGDGKTDDGTLRDSIFRMIDSLPISKSEKDGLALISYGIKSIRKNAPWHKK